MSIIINGQTIVNGQMIVGPSIVSDGVIEYLDPSSNKTTLYRNLLPSSNLSAWQKIRCECVLTSEVVSPIDTNDVYLFTITDATSLVRLAFQGPLIFDYDNVGLTHVFSVYAKQKNTQASSLELAIYNANYTYGIEPGFQIQNNFAVTQPTFTGSEYIGDGWYRLYSSINPTTFNYAFNAFLDIESGTKINGEGLYLWGPQFEVGSVPTEYQGFVTKTISSVIGSPKVALNNGASVSKIDGGFFIFDGSNDTMSNIGTSTCSEWTLNFFQKQNLVENYFAANTIFSNTPATGIGKEGDISWNNTIFYSVDAVLVDSSDNIYAGGQHAGYDSVFRPAVTKISSDGSINSWNVGYSDGGVLHIATIYEDPNGLIYMRGTNIGTGAGVIIRNNDGTTTDITQIPASNSLYDTMGLVVDEVNEYLYLGVAITTVFTSSGTVAKGIVKMDLQTKAFVTEFDTSISGFDNGAVAQIMLDSNKDLYVVGTFTSYKSTSANRIVKLKKEDATIDTSFIYGTGFGGEIYKKSFLIQNDGKLLVAGAFTAYNGTSSIGRIIRLNTDGSIDSSFTTGIGFNNSVTSLLLQSDGKIVAAGTFSSYNGTPMNKIARLNSDGTLDSSFVIGTGPNAAITGIGLQSTGKIIIVGTSITSYNGTAVGRSIVRINTNGSVDSSFINAGFNKPLARTNMYFYLENNVLQAVYSGLFGINPARNSFYGVNGGVLYNNMNMFTVTFGQDKYFRFYLNGVYKNQLYSTSGANCGLQLETVFANHKLYNLSLYNRALSVTEILKTYNALKTRFI